MDTDNVVEVEGGNNGDGYLWWTTEMDGLMLEILREQKIKGQKEDRAFSAEAYRKVVEEINEKFSLNISRNKVLNRLKTLKEQMVLAKELQMKSGIGWNDTSKMFEAPKEVWKSLIKANPKLRHIQGKPLHHLDLLREIYEKDVATGAQAESAREKVQRWERERREINIDDIDELQANNEIHLENFHPFDCESAPATPTSQGPSSSTPSVSKTSASKGKKQKTPMTSEYSADLKEVSTAMKEIASAILNISTQVWKPAEIFEAVGKLGLEGRTLYQAFEWLVEHPNLIGILFGCPEEFRLDWLATKLGW